MAHALKKFKLLEKKVDEPAQNQPVDKPLRKNKLQLYNHIASKFEISDKDERRRIAQERLRQRQEEKDAKLEAERRKKEEEQERMRLKKEEEERQKRLKEEEEERMRIEEEIRLAEEEEQKRLEKIKQQHEGKYAGLKPAAAMFERALDAKRSVQKSVRGERVITLRKGTISEIRSKIFDNAPQEQPVPKQLKQGPKKLIIPDKKDETVNKELKTNEGDKVESKKSEVIKNVSDKTRTPDQETKVASTKIKDAQKKETVKMRSDEEKPEDENTQDTKLPKRQSFISDFAALEKTYKILGLSKDPPKNEDKAPVKKRHNSEGKVKNKDKVKANRKSNVLSDVEPLEAKESSPQKEVKIDAMDKGRAIAKRSFFQDLINEKKGTVKKEPELIGPQIRKKASLINAFEQNPDDIKRNSMKEEVKVDTHRFNTFLNKFENKDQRAEGKAQMIKITNQQKEFERQKQLKEKRQLVEQQEQQKIQKEQEEMELQAAIEEEIQIQKIREAEEAEFQLQQLEEAERKAKENEDLSQIVAEKKKIVKKKKKVKKEEESSNIEEMPKLALAVVNYNDVKSKFERKKSEDLTEVTGPTKPLRINKLINNPFLENIKPEERPVSRDIKVNKLKKNSFMQQLEKRGSVAEDYQQTKEKTVVKKEEPKKKISSEATIKFESKKEKKTSQDNGDPEENKNERRTEIRVSKSIEGHNPMKKKISRENKSGSTMSLQKIFIDGPREFFRSSKEKLYKLSKETLCEFNEQIEETKPTEQKPSRNDMQNYLLSHVLFDGKDVVKKEKVNKKNEDDIDQYLDKDYKAKIDQYCSLLEDEKPQKKKKKKKPKEKKVEEKLPSIKTNEIKSIQQQLQQQQQKPTEKTSVKIDDSVFTKNESKVNKFREMFDTDNQNEVKVLDRGQDSRKSKRVKSDIFLKIQALENAEKERLEREKENEERIKILLQMEMERHQNNQGENEEDNSEDEAEENLKHNILQCLEDEVQNLEQEMLALENEEQLILEEEAEEIEEAALMKYETNIDEDDTELAEHINQLQEIHVEIEERKKAASKKKKVLERFQHVFDKEELEQKSGVKVGSIHDRLANFLDNKDTKNTKVFEDNVFVGVSDVMSKFKNKLETQEDETPALFTRDEIRRKPNPTALKFEMMNIEDDDDVTSPKTPTTKDWNWKKKTPEELQTETVGSETTSCPPEKKKSRNFQDTKFNELLADINAVKQRMNERDAKRQEKENEQKIREMEEAIKEVQEALDAKDEVAFEDSDSDESDTKSVEVKPKRRTAKKKEVKPVSLNTTGNKIGELKTQLMTMINDDIQEKSGPKENIDVSVSKIKQKILYQEESQDKEQDRVSRPNKTASSHIITKLAEKLEQEEKEEEVQLRKAPKLLLKNDVCEDNEVPAKTLEELKAENQNQKWAWKEKDMTDLQDYISSYDDIAPDKIMDQHQILKDLEDEQKVVESLTDNKDTAILVQIREEKEREFNKFMAGVKSYLSEDNKTTEEIEFKKGMQSYLSLIDDDRNETKEDKSQPRVKLNTVSKLKSSLFDSYDTAAEKKTSPKVNKLNKDKLELGFREAESAKLNKVDPNVTSEKTQLVKKMFEDKKEKSPNISPKDQGQKTEKTSIFERYKRKAMEEKQTKLEHQIKYKQKTITELHEYIEHNENLANEKLMASIRDFKIRKEEEKVKYHEVFVDTLTKFLAEQCRSDEENIFRGNIKAYLTILENVDSIYNATPKLRKHKGSVSQSNMRKAILEKSCERPQIKTVDPPMTNNGFASKNVDNKTSIVSKISKELNVPQKVLDPEEKRKEICTKYGIKDRSQIVIQAISDDSEDSNDSDDEVDMKKLTDKELAEKYGLPYFEVAEEEDIKQSDSTAGFSSLLSKIRQAQSDKSQSISQAKQRFEQNKPTNIPRGKDSNVTKSDSTARIKNVYESLSPTNSRSSSPFSNYEPGSVVTSRMKKRYEDNTPERRSFISDGSNSRCNSPLPSSEEIFRSGSTTRMKQVFETDSPSNSRSSSPLLRREPGSIITSKIKKRFEGAAEPPRRQSLIPDDAVATMGSANKIKNMFESSTGNEQRTPIMRNRGLEKSSTVSNIGSIFQQSGPETPATKLKLADAFFNQEKSRNNVSSIKSPLLNRSVPLEKCKSLSKIKNAFETGKGLNDEDDVIDKLETRKSIHAELELLRSSGNGDNVGNSSPIISQRKAISGIDTEKASLAASFFTQDKRERNKSLGGISTKEKKSDDPLDIGRRNLNAELSELKGLGNIQNILKPSTSLQKSTTVSDIGSYLKHKFEESPKVTQKSIPTTQASKTKSAIFDTNDDEGRIGTEKTSLAASFFTQEKREQSKSFSKSKEAFDGGIVIKEKKPDDPLDIERKKINAELSELKGLGNIQNILKPSTTSQTTANRGLQKSTTVSDIGSYLKHKFEESPKVTRKSIPSTEATKNKSAVFDSNDDEDVIRTPVLGRRTGVEKSRSFSKFKNAFEDGVGIMNDSEDYDVDKMRVNAELNALKSSSKIQSMFRMNKSKSNINDSPKLDHIDLDDDTMKDVQKSRSAITNMFEAQGPKMTFGGTLKQEKAEPPKPKPAAKKESEEDINGRKWVFDTIQKYFDVIVEEEKEEEEEEEEEDEADDENCDDSDSDYTDAEDELPEINLPVIATRNAGTPKLPETTKTPPVQQKTASPEIKNKFSTLTPKSPILKRFSPSLSVPVHRATSLRASTISPLALPRFSSERKTSVISIDNFVDDAAKQFDQLTDGSDCSLNDHSDNEKQTIPLRKISQTQSASTQSMNKLAKSGSSSKIRGMFNSVVHGSGSSVNVSTFKSNLLAHLKLRGSGNLDPGVCDDSSSEYSEYD